MPTDDDPWLLMVLANGIEYGPFADEDVAKQVRDYLGGTFLRLRPEQWGDRQTREEVELMFWRISDETVEEEE